jgi:hypothetical protein
MRNLDQKQEYLDPIEQLQNNLIKGWAKMCALFDAQACLPDMHAIFDQVDLRDPCGAAEQIVVNLLLEVMEEVSRFSPWYKQLPRAYGLTSIRDARTNQIKWVLAPEGYQQWEILINQLEWLIQNYRGIYQALLLVEGLMARSTPADPQVTATCQCDPPNIIHLRKSLVEKGEVFCDNCKSPFRLIKEPS